MREEIATGKVYRGKCSNGGVCNIDEYRVRVTVNIDNISDEGCVYRIRETGEEVTLKDCAGICTFRRKNGEIVVGTLNQKAPSPPP